MNSHSLKEQSNGECLRRLACFAIMDDFELNVIELNIIDLNIIELIAIELIDTEYIHIGD